MKSIYAVTYLYIAGLLLTLPNFTYAFEASSKEVLEGHKLIDNWNIGKAELFTNSLLGKYPESGDAHFLKARVEFLKGNHTNAVKILKQVADSHLKVRAFKKLVYTTHEETKLFITKESKHFIYRFKKGPDEILVHYAAKVLEKSYKVLGKLFDYYPKEKVLIEF